MLQNALPALLLLALMIGIALALKWARGRVPGLVGVAGSTGPALRVLSTLSLGPQQRVVTVQVGQGDEAICLVLGVAPGAVQTLHSLALPTSPVADPPTSSVSGFGARLAQLRGGAGAQGGSDEKR